VVLYRCDLGLENMKDKEDILNHSHALLQRTSNGSFLSIIVQLTIHSIIHTDEQKVQKYADCMPMNKISITIHTTAITPTKGQKPHFINQTKHIQGLL
jgi:hypothetical protein